MADTIQKYEDYVMTGFLKSVAPIVVDKAIGAAITDISSLMEHYPVDLPFQPLHTPHNWR
jgi:hypothetical protein